MSLLTVGSVAFDAIETPFGKTDKIVGGAGTYIALSASNFTNDQKIVSVVGDDFPQETLATLTAKGVDLAGLQIKQGEKIYNFTIGDFADFCKNLTFIKHNSLLI